MPSTSYAQYGQDLLLAYVLARADPRTKAAGYRGTYVDVGCFHPVNGSNTNLFYARGWSGLCVDANPDFEEAFRAARPRDTVMVRGIGAEEGTLRFHRFDNPQHNTFNAGRAERFPDRVRSVIEVRVSRLNDVVAEAFPDGRPVDLFSLDAEGYDERIILATDFTAFRPTVVMVELMGPPLRVSRHPIARKLEASGYALSASTGHDAVFVRSPG